MKETIRKAIRRIGRSMTPQERRLQQVGNESFRLFGRGSAPVNPSVQRYFARITEQSVDFGGPIIRTTDQ